MENLPRGPGEVKPYYEDYSCHKGSGGTTLPFVVVTPTEWGRGENKGHVPRFPVLPRVPRGPRRPLGHSGILAGRSTPSGPPSGAGHRRDEIPSVETRSILLHRVFQVGVNSPTTLSRASLQDRRWWKHRKELKQVYGSLTFFRERYVYTYSVCVWRGASTPTMRFFTRMYVLVHVHEMFGLLCVGYYVRTCPRVCVCVGVCVSTSVLLYVCGDTCEESTRTEWVGTPV